MSTKTFYKFVLVILVIGGLMVFANKSKANNKNPGTLSSVSGNPEQLAKKLEHLWEQGEYRFAFRSDAKNKQRVWAGINALVNIHKYKAARCTAQGVWGSTYANPFKFENLAGLAEGRGEMYIAKLDSSSNATIAAIESVSGRGSETFIYMAIYRFDDGREPIGVSVGLRFNKLPFGNYSHPELVAYTHRYLSGSVAEDNEQWEPSGTLLGYNSNDRKLRWNYTYHQNGNNILMGALLRELPFVSSLLYRSVTKLELGFMDYDRCIK